MNKYAYFLFVLVLLISCGNPNSREQNIGELIINSDLNITLDTVLNNLNEPDDVYVSGQSIYYSVKNNEAKGDEGAYNIMAFDEATQKSRVVYTSNTRPFGLIVNDSCMFITSREDEQPTDNAQLLMYNFKNKQLTHITDSLAEPFDIDTDKDGNIYVGAIIKDNERSPLVKYKAPEYIEYDRELDGHGEILSFDYGNDFIWFSNAGGIAKTQDRSTWSVSFINGVTGLLVTQNYIYYTKYEYNLLGRIDMFTGENEVLLENVLRPYKMTYSDKDNALYLIVNDNAKEHTSKLLKLVVENDLANLY
ncbi:hypothetical protein ACE1ET_14845 [Saccharicrinis sp. FJH62]|uniref:hypothetical protein n=1 Tax=Saccharicrinis sp. FJH62 TaxID=3344657 RepID=UPI0035D3F381